MEIMETPVRSVKYALLCCVFQIFIKYRIREYSKEVRFEIGQDDEVFSGTKVGGFEVL